MIFGGYNVFGKNAEASRFFTKSPTSQVTVMFDLYQIDSWDQETFFFEVDNNNVVPVWSKKHDQKDFPALTPGYQFQANESQLNPNCGWKREVYLDLDLVTKVSFTFPHSGSLMKIKLRSNLDQDAADESWGIKNFCIYETVN